MGSVDATAVLLQDRQRLKRAVVRSFKKVANGAKSLDLMGLQSFRDKFCQSFTVPPMVFGDLVTEYLCFDFDGSGRLAVPEVYKLVKFELLSYRKRAGFSDNPVDVPFRTLQDAGYSEKRLLGEGGQGQVKLVVDTAGREFCVKCLPRDALSFAGIQELMEEFAAVQFLACERVAQVSELFQDDMFFYMVGEAYMGGDFMTLKERASEQGVTIDENYYRNIFQQCFEGLKFMHSQAMMHCDIKEPNLMIKTPNFKNPDVVIIDFGVAKAMAEGPGGLPRGTPGYMPPETLDTGKWFPKGDCFCMGVCMIQMVLDMSPPLGARTNLTPGGIFIEGCITVEDMCQATRTREPPLHLMPLHMTGLTRLLRELLRKKMTRRPTTFCVLKDRWFALSRPEHKLKGRHARATDGITESFLRTTQNEADMTPSALALHQVHSIVSNTEAPPADP